MREFLVAPSILSADFAKLGDEIRALERAGADWVHVDVMDGRFVPNLTLGAPIVRALRPVTKLPFDVHLMIEEPERYLKDFAAAGADYLTIHVESTADVAKTLAEISRLNVRPGITLKPGTAVETIFPFLTAVELVLIMTVEPGFGGQSFMDAQVEKIARVRAEAARQATSVLIEVDGGINAETARRVRDADVLVAGNYVFKNEYAHAIHTLKRARI